MSHKKTIPDNIDIMLQLNAEERQVLAQALVFYGNYLMTMPEEEATEQDHQDCDTVGRIALKMANLTILG
jgi:hypothetical protein